MNTTARNTVRIFAYLLTATALIVGAVTGYVWAHPAEDTTVCYQSQVTGEWLSDYSTTGYCTFGAPLNTLTTPTYAPDTATPTQPLIGDDNKDGTIMEDETGWNCATMGNRVCGGIS